MDYLTPDDLAERCAWAKPTGNGWLAVCPVHEDRSPSLSISEGKRATLIYCHAGCSFDELAVELGFEQQQLFHDYSPHAVADTSLNMVMAQMIRDARPIPYRWHLRFSDVMHEALSDGKDLWWEGKALCGLEYPHVADLPFMEGMEMPKTSLDGCVTSFLTPYLRENGYRFSPFEVRRAALMTMRRHWREHYA